MEPKSVTGNIRAHFLTPLDVRLLHEETSGNTRWMLLADLQYVSALLRCELVVPSGFVTDFASVPKALPMAYSLFADIAHKAAVVHDFLYQTRLVSEKAVADNVFLEAMESLGIVRWRREAMWAGVHVGGGSAWDSGPHRYTVLNPKGGDVDVN